MAITDFLKPIGNQLLQTGANLLTNRLLRPNQQNLIPGISNQLLGGGLLLGGSLADKEPGEVLQARQFLRNRFTEPQGLSSQFTGQLGALSQQFQPLLTQQRQRGIADISQRFAAAFPSRVGAQGPEFGTLSRYITDEALPREQALLGNLGLEMLGAQERAAGKILDTSKPDPTASAISQLGGMLLARDALGGTTLLNQVGQPIGQVNAKGQLIPHGVQPSPTQLGQLSPAELATQVARTGGPPTAGGHAVTDFGLPGPGLLGPAGFTSAQGLLSSLGAGAAGFGAGTVASNLGQNQFQAGGGGAVSGAALGFAVGGPIGAVIGGVTGAITGFTKERAQQHATKVQRHADDLASQQNNVSQVGSFWVNALGASGFGAIDEFASAVKSVTAQINDADERFRVPSAGIDVQRNQVTFGSDSNTDEGELIAGLGSQLLLKEIQKTRPEITDLDQVPNFRQSYIDYLLANIRHEGGVTPTTSTFGGVLDAAGISR